MEDMKKRALKCQDSQNPCANRYSLSFILDIVSEVERGKISMKGAGKKYNIKGSHTVKDWLKKYGQLNWIEKGEDVLKSKRASMENKELQNLKDENYKLKTKVLVYEKVIELSKRDLNIDLKKNYGLDALKNLREQKDEQ